MLTRHTRLETAILILGACVFCGCSHQSQSGQPVTMAPPQVLKDQGNGQVDQQNIGQSPQQNGQAQGQNPQGNSVYNWQDVPLNQNVPIVRATFDQSGYQLFDNNGETIVIPFTNNNLYVMKFGRSSGQPYFINDGAAPTLYVGPNDYIENAAAQNARWYPLPESFAYTQPVYVGLAPSWNEYTAMGWYPGMNYYGGMWGATPYYAGVHWMPSFYINIGGRRYSDYASYHTYYVSTPGYTHVTRIYNYPTTRSTGSFGGFGHSTGSFGSTRSNTGSFGTRTSTGFGTSSNSKGSFGSFGSNRNTQGTSAFGSLSGSKGSFGTSLRRAGSSFGGGGQSTGSPFGGGGRSTGSSFGGSGHSFGGGGRTFGSKRH